MKIKDVRPLSDDELRNKIDDLRKQLMELQFKRRTGVEKPHLFTEIKKDIARIMTILKERQILSRKSNAK